MRGFWPRRDGVAACGELADEFETDAAGGTGDEVGFGHGG